MIHKQNYLPSDSVYKWVVVRFRTVACLNGAIEAQPTKSAPRRWEWGK